MPGVEHRCKDCRADPPGRVRAAKYPGPRCHTHHYARRKAVRKARHGSHIVETYGITPEDYRALYVAQGGRCAGCRIATGRSKALAVDHDHRCVAGHSPAVGCRLCVRGLLCSTCNQLLGKVHDNPVRLFRLGLYLINPPSVDTLPM